MTVLTFYHIELMQSAVLEEEWLHPFACTPKPLVITSTVEPLGTFGPVAVESDRC